MSDVPGGLGLEPAQVADVLTTAGRAPSLHNTQPWWFRVRPDVIELHADPSRSLPVTDPESREMRLACGAALYTLRLALHGHGIRPLVTIRPDPDDPDLIAAVRHGGSRPATPEQRTLLRAVPLRHTNRRPFADTPVGAAERSAMRRAAQEEGVWLHEVLDPLQRARLRDLAVRAHHTQLTDPGFRDEMERWTAVSPDRADGVPATAGGPLPEPHRVWTLRDFTGGTGARLDPAKDPGGEPLVAVLSAYLTGPHAEIQAGQAMQRVLLTATVHGLAASFVSQIVEVPSIREELRRLVGGTLLPQVVLRVGYGHPVLATPRRPATDLLAPHPCAAEN
ncbi:Acg family FMN-binding oxidoreductase [Pseudonocardia sp.]|uniref:Acg family FMN-binding oxidoreductase n=1 Tax=Pseudonocardia sp. TaxID=60912 RepID=UPI003D0C7E5D